MRKYIDHYAITTKMFPSDVRIRSPNPPEKSTETCFDDKMANKSGKGFLLTTNLYKSSNNAAILDTKNRNPEGKAAIHTEGMEVKKQDNTTKKNHDAENSCQRAPCEARPHWKREDARNC